MGEKSGSYGDGEHGERDEEKIILPMHYKARSNVSSGRIYHPFKAL